MSDISPEAWRDWLRELRERFISKQGWTEKEATRHIHDAWAVVRDDQVQVLANDSQRPTGAVPVFLMLTSGGWKLPIRILERLSGSVKKAMSSQRPPRDIVMGLLSQAEHTGSPDEGDEIKQKRHSAAFWGHQLFDACEDEALAGVLESDVFWQAILSAFQAGRRHAILELYENPQLMADQLKAQAFQSGRAPDELTRRLKASYLKQRAELGRDPRPREAAKAAGGVWSDVDTCWQFGELGSVTHRGLCERLKDIRNSRPV